MNPADPRTLSTSLEAELPALRQRLLRQARLAVYDAAQAEDLVQETLLAVVQQGATHRGDAALATWAIAILRNKVADWYRSPTYRRMTQLASADDSGALGDDLDALFDESGHYREPVPAWQQPDNHVERKQLMHALDGCVNCLPNQTRRVFMMREWLGFESTEICQRLSISADNCRTILHRARMSLRECMQRTWYGGHARA